MKKNKTVNIIIIIVFLLIIFLPQLLFWIFGNNEEVSNTENRVLKSKPKFELSNIVDYPKQFDDYYNDHLPFRDNLRKYWSLINYKLFNTSIDSSVIIGKDGWLFYRGDNTIEKLTASQKYTEDEKENILNTLKNNINKFKEQNIKTYVMIAPDKENIYSEKLPKSIKKAENTATEELISYVEKNSNINVVYPKENLLNVKDKYQLYRKYDTHWNTIGALIGTVSIQKEINNNFDYDVNNIEFEKIDEIDKRDLSTFINLQDELFENKINIKNFYDNIEYKENKTDVYEEYISNSQNNQTVMFIGDSFRTNMKPTFSKLYKRVVYLHRDKYTYDLIEKIKPDIVVIEAVERSSYQIGKDLVNIN